MTICILVTSFTSLRVLSWSLPSAPQPTFTMSSARPNTFSKPLNISSIILWNTSPAGASPKGTLVNLQLPNWHANVVNMRFFNKDLDYDNLKWHQLWSCSTLLLVWVVYHLMLVPWVLAVLVPGWALLGPVTVILFHWALGVHWSCCTIWLFHLPLVVAVSADLVVFSFLNHSCIVYATHLGGMWYGFVPS